MHRLSKLAPRKTPRYDYIQKVLRPKGTWTLTDSRLKVVNNFKRSFDKILRKAGVKTGTFHDIRRTAISMWFANGMSEYDVMTLAGHSSFATTHKFYLAVADDLVHRARLATAQGLCQKMVQNGADAIFDHQQKKASSCNYLPQNDLPNGQGRI